MEPPSTAAVSGTASTSADVSRDERLQKLRDYVENDLDDEKRITFYSRCNEQLKRLEKTAEPKKKERQQQLKTQVEQLKETMMKNSWDCVPLDSEGTVFLRQVLKPPPGRHIVPGLVEEVLGSLREDVDFFNACAQAVVDDQHERYVAWQAKQRKAKKGKAGLEAAFSASSIPPEMETRYVGPAKAYPCRRYTAIGRPLTAKELLAEIIYVAIKSKNKPVASRPALAVLRKFGRGKNDRRSMRIPKEEEIDETTRALLAEYYKTTTICTEEECNLSKEKEQYCMAMELCEPWLKEYVPKLSSDAKVTKTMTLENGEREVTLSVIEKPVPKRSATLWDVSELVDAAVADVPDLTGPADIPAVREAFLATSEALCKRIQPEIAARIAAGTKTAKTLNICRGQLTKPRGLKRMFDHEDDDAVVDEVLSDGDGDAGLPEDDYRDDAEDDEGAEDLEAV